MGFLDNMKRTIQKIIPGGKTGSELMKRTIQKIIPGGKTGSELPNGRQPTQSSTQPAPQPGDILTPTSNAGQPGGEAGVPSFTENEARDMSSGSGPGGSDLPRGSKVIGKDTSPSQALSGQGVTTAGVDYQPRLITPEEIDAGFTQQDINAGMSASSAGGIVPVTASDVLSVSSGVTGIASIVKGLAGLAGKATAKATAAGAYKSATITVKGVTKNVDDIAGSALKNPKTVGLLEKGGKKLVGESVWIKLGSASLALSVVYKVLESTLGGKNFGEFLGMEEAVQSVSYPKTLAYQQGNWEAYDLAKEATDELLEKDSFWDGLKKLVPFSNVASGTDEFRAAAVTGGIVMDMLAEDKRNAEENGLSESDQYRKNTEDRLTMERANTDYFNEQRIITEDKIREADNEDMEKDAEFWRKEKAYQLEQELANQQAIADLWLAYAIQRQKLSDDSGPSHLNFGGLF